MCLFVPVICICIKQLRELHYVRSLCFVNAWWQLTGLGLPTCDLTLIPGLNSTLNMCMTRFRVVLSDMLKWEVFYFAAIQGYLFKRLFHSVLQYHRVEKAKLVGVWTELRWALDSCCRAVRCVSGAEASAKDTRSKRSASWVFLPANPKAPFSWHFLSYLQTKPPPPPPNPPRPVSIPAKR